MPQTNGGSLFSAAFARSRSCEAHWSRQLVWLMERDGRLSRSKPSSLLMSCYIEWQHHNSLILIRSPSWWLAGPSCCQYSYSHHELCSPPFLFFFMSAQSVKVVSFQTQYIYIDWLVWPSCIHITHVFPVARTEITETSSRRALTQPRRATVVSHILVLYIIMLLFYYVQFWLVVNMYQTLFMRSYGISIFCWNIPEKIILLVFFFVLNW